VTGGIGVEAAPAGIELALHQAAEVTCRAQPDDNLLPAQRTQALLAESIFGWRKFLTRTDDFPLEHARILGRAWSISCKAVVYRILGLTLARPVTAFAVRPAFLYGPDDECGDAP